MAAHERLSGRAYLLAWIGLLVLTGASFGFTYIPLGDWGTFVALGIAAVKALVVVLIFMHLFESRFATQIVPIVTFLFIVFLCLGIAADVTTR